MRHNDQIRVPQVRLIDEDGSQVGVVDTREAQERAYQKDLDLVEVASNASPPVCRIMDYGKYKYKLEISEKEKKKKQTQVVVKEIKLRPKIDTNDLNTKTNHIKRFLKSGNKVKVTVMFRGREIVHKEIAMEMLQQLIRDLEGLAAVEQAPKLEGYNMIMVLGPA
ncbi:MAG: translation initiation factor IF-3 [Actinomycetota bacterium]|nr:translation initiation factor IF-3 [Actinomycetota bacterium]